MQFQPLHGGYGRLQLVPDPHGDELAGGIGQAGDMIEAFMVQCAHYRFDDLFQHREIHYPSQLRIGLAFDPYTETVGMAMHFLALMSVWYIREPMGGVECELFVDEHRIECGAKGTKVARPLA